MVVIIYPLHLEQRFYSISFHVYGKGQLLRATCHCCCERLCLYITSYYCFSPKCLCLFFFFLKLQHPKLIGRGNISKKQPTNKVKSTNKDGERNRKGRRKKEGGGSVQFSLETYRIVGAAWRCSSASIESEFLLLNSIQRYHNLKRLLLPRGFQMKPSERDF